MAGKKKDTNKGAKPKPARGGKGGKKPEAPKPSSAPKKKVGKDEEE